MGVGSKRAKSHLPRGNRPWHTKTGVHKRVMKRCADYSLASTLLFENRIILDSGPNLVDQNMKVWFGVWIGVDSIL